jgi:hypothetical protein
LRETIVDGAAIGSLKMARSKEEGGDEERKGGDGRGEMEKKGKQNGEGRGKTGLLYENNR